MKKYILVYAVCILSVVVFPLMLKSRTIGGGDVKYTRGQEKSDYTITLYIKSEDRVAEMDIEEYMYGVVGAEMPASFPLEALKAQAVAARTFAVNRKENGTEKESKHKGADLCSDYTHCKAWISREERMRKWDEQDREKYMKKIIAAVDDTKGIIMTYGGKPITAVFYAISSGKTENSKDVWGGDLPYLKSVDSPYDSEAPGYATTAEFTLEEFKRRICAEFKNANFVGEPSDWYKNEVRSEGGAVVSCEVGGVKIKGTQMRTIFNLRSHNYNIELNDKVTFNVKGYGHGVGMSQWGAKFHAEKGKNYRDILRNYYSGIDFENISK